MKYSDLGIANIPDYLSPGWNTKKIGEFVFDQQFMCEGIPLSWFYKRMFCPHTIPPILKVKSKIERFLDGQPIQSAVIDAVRNAALRKAFFFNEKIKMQLNADHADRSGKKILFLTYLEHINPQTGNIFRIEEIINNIEKNKRLSSLILSASAQSQSFISLMRQKSKIKRPINLIYNYITPEIKNKAQEWSLKTNRQWKKLDQKIKQQMLGTSLWNAMQDAFDFYLSREFLYILAIYYETCKSIIEKNGIKAIVITSQNSIFERCFNAAANQVHCPVVLLQHGAAMGSIDPDLLEPYSIAVFSHKYKKTLEQQGIPAKNVEVVGPIIFDEIYPFIGKEPNSPSSGPRILILTVPFVEQNIFTPKKYFACIEKICTEIASIPNSTVTIKLHPREKYYGDYQKMIQRLHLPSIRVIQNDQRVFLYQLMSRSDIIINFSSTSAIEAMILDKPLITITFPDFHNPLNDILRISQATVEIPVQDNLTPAIKTLLSDRQLQQRLQQRRRRFVKEYCGRIDGKSSQRMTHLLQKLVKSSENTYI